MSAIYYLGFLGQPADHVEAKLRETLGRMVGEFALTLGVEVGLSGAAFTPKPGMAAAALYFGFPGAKDTPELTRLVRQEVPIIPVVSGLTQFGVETPPGLRHLNGLDLDSQDEDCTGLAAALLECVGLLPRLRRVFVSYRRTESRMAAVQLFEELSARKFDVFLDTHDVLAGKKFQEELWHRLSDSDVVVMLHTPDYFTSSWTAQEFFRALGKRISILRVEWPATMVAPKVATATATAMKLAAHDLTMTGELSSDALTAICSQVESVRSKSIAIRQTYLAGWIKSEVEAIQGVVEGVGPIAPLLSASVAAPRFWPSPAWAFPPLNAYIKPPSIRRTASTAPMRLYTTPRAARHGSLSISNGWVPISPLYVASLPTSLTGCFLIGRLPRNERHLSVGQRTGARSRGLP